ncbi:hypothetical protein [Treponema sp.]|uniref:hypothetical protein n=1 Tax=Treponema sp. TaxID=166 RepID=UPI003EFEA81A
MTCIEKRAVLFAAAATAVFFVAILFFLSLLKFSEKKNFTEPAAVSIFLSRAAAEKIPEKNTAHKDSPAKSSVEKKAPEISSSSAFEAEPISADMDFNSAENSALDSAFVNSGGADSSGEKESGGRVFLEMSGGKKRELLHPETPFIEISSEHARLVDSTRRVLIRFRVLADGTVPLEKISIVPPSLLPFQIQAEIKKQIHGWLFSPGEEGTVCFEYTLEIT